MNAHRPLRSRRREAGSTLIMFVLALTALLGIVALVTDVGQAFVDKRRAQNAVDAAALAGVEYLPSASTAVSKANEYLTLNGLGAGDSANTVTITTPYQGSATRIFVQVSHTLGAWFGAVVGQNSYSVTASAVAERRSNNYALFQTGPNPNDPAVDDPNCNGELELEGKTLSITGDAHADGEFEIKAENSGPGSGQFDINVTGAITYVCKMKVEGSSVSIGSGPTQLPAPLTPPVSRQYSNFSPCTFNVTGDLKIDMNTPQYFVNNDFNSGQLKPGLYCATGEIEMVNDIPSSSITGNVTFVAHKEVKLRHNNMNLTPFMLDTLAFTDGCNDHDGEGEIEFEGQNITFTGILLAACGQIELKGNSITSSSTLIVAGKIELKADNINLTAFGFNLSKPRLIQ